MGDAAVPELRTERLILRGWRDGDAAAHAAMAQDAEVARYIGGVQTAEQSWRSMAMHAGHWTLRGYGHWVIERTSDGSVLGRAGLWNPQGWPGLEIGWKLAREAWGHGYATEAGAAAIQWAWTTLHASRLISVIHPENAASMRVAGRLGLRRSHQDAVGDQPVWIYSIDRPTAVPGTR